MDNPLFTEDDYPNKFLRGYSIFPNDARIFHLADHRYDHITALTSTRFEHGVYTIGAVMASSSHGFRRAEIALGGGGSPPGIAVESMARGAGFRPREPHAGSTAPA